ncbi:DUF6988 family protein [Roseateles sp. DXS20W]|uniref:DUF6988 family protein n=1 Tax=Pelomonas lactea TaxID=3299030 RepID=A0ABW7GPY7_9BURK
MGELDEMLAKSHDFAEHLLGMFGEDIEWFGGDRPEAAAAAAELAFEHAHALRVLFSAGTPNSGAAMLRLQYEALLRAAWLLYSAPESPVEKLSAFLTEETAATAKNVISAEKMLLALESTAEKAPNLRGLVLQLRELRDSAWAPMNGFVHAGLHALARTQDGFPAELGTNLVKLSNGMLPMSARLLARTTTSVALVTAVDKVYERFVDVLPVVAPGGN